MTTSTAALCPTEYHVAKRGDDKNDGSLMAPFLTIAAASQVAQAGDVITVHEGVYRERVNPPRGGTSDEQRIVYQAATGEKVSIKGSEVVTDWTHVAKDIWTVTLPNTFFGDFNPFNDLIQGDWFHDKGRTHHTGAVYLNGHWLAEAAKKENLFDPTTQVHSQNLLQLAWMQTDGDAPDKVAATALVESQGIVPQPLSEHLGQINDGDWASYRINFGESSEHLDFHLAPEKQGGIIEIHLDAPDGDLLATCIVPEADDGPAWRTLKTIIVPSSGEQMIYLVFKAKPNENHDVPLWFAEVDDQTTTIWAQFEGVNPNEELVEVNARQTVFYPSQPGINYITARGFTLEHAATPWAPPTAEQIGLIGTHWSKGWIIEENTIRYATCVGVTLGKYGDEFDNKSATADAYNRTIDRAIKNGWHKDHIGHHLVQNNEIYHCEEAAIIGSLGAIFSTITGNDIHDIYTRQLFAGYEIAGIKFHAPIDSVISNNHIYRCEGSGGGIWLDWMAQGTHISGNLMHHNSVDLFFEVNHGPYTIDGNIFLSPTFLRDWSQGGAFAHNLIAGTMSVSPQQRETPTHPAHSTEIIELRSIDCGDQRFINNLFVQGQNLDHYAPFSDSMLLEGNLFLETKATLKETATGTYLSVDGACADAQPRTLVTSERLGRTLVSKQPFIHPDGSPLKLSTDYFGKTRSADTPSPGPFEDIATIHDIQLWPK